MMNECPSDAEMDIAVAGSAKRSGAESATATGDRSTTLRRSRRRSPARSSSALEISPNSRRSRASSVTSSHLQGRVALRGPPLEADLVMGISNFIGIDVSKKSLDVAMLPDGTLGTVPNTAEGFQTLLSRTPESDVQDIRCSHPVTCPAAPCSRAVASPVVGVQASSTFAHRIGLD